MQKVLENDNFDFKRGIVPNNKAKICKINPLREQKHADKLKLKYQKLKVSDDQRKRNEIGYARRMENRLRKGELLKLPDSLRVRNE